jgi:hypothetical protein
MLGGWIKSFGLGLGLVVGVVLLTLLTASGQRAFADSDCGKCAMSECGGCDAGAIECCSYIDPGVCNTCGECYTDCDPYFGAICENRGCSGVGCFLPGTEIKTGTGVKTIEKVEAGDLVTSFDEENKTVSSSEVTKIYKVKRDYYYEINTQSGETVKVTAEHPFFVGGESVNACTVQEGGFSGYKTAEDLVVGDKVYILKDNKLEKTQIIKKVKVDEPVTAYNLSVDNKENFIANGFAVHNKSSANVSGEVYCQDPGGPKYAMPGVRVDLEAEIHIYGRRHWNYTTDSSGRYSTKINTHDVPRENCNWFRIWIDKSFLSGEITLPDGRKQKYADMSLASPFAVNCGDATVCNTNANHCSGLGCLDNGNQYLCFQRGNLTLQNEGGASFHFTGCTPTTPTPGWGEKGCYSDSMTATGLGMLKRNDIFLNLDVTGSMATYWPINSSVTREQCNTQIPTPGGCQKKVDSAEEAVRSFALWLNPASDKMSLGTFHAPNQSFDIQVRTPFTSDFNEVNGALVEFNPSGMTPSLFSLEKAVQEFDASGRPEAEVEDRYVIMASDGQQNIPFGADSSGFFHYLYGGYSNSDCNTWNNLGGYCPGTEGIIGDLRSRGVQVYAVGVGPYEWDSDTNQMKEINPDGMIRIAAATSKTCSGEDPQTCLPPTISDSAGEPVSLQCLEQFNCFRAGSAEELNEIMVRIRALIQGSMVLPVLSDKVTDAKLYWSYRTRWENTLDDKVSLVRERPYPQAGDVQEITGLIIPSPPPLNNNQIGVNNLRPYSYVGNLPKNSDIQGNFILNQGLGLYVGGLGVIPYPPPTGDLSTFGGGEGVGLTATFDLGANHHQTLEWKEFNKYLVPAGGGAAYGPYTESKSPVVIFDLCSKATDKSACQNFINQEGFDRNVQLTLMIAGRDPVAVMNSAIYVQSSSSIDFPAEITDNGAIAQGIKLQPDPALLAGFKGNSMNTLIFDSAISEGLPLHLPKIPNGHRYVRVQIKSPAGGEDMTLMMAALETACQAEQILSDGDFQLPAGSAYSDPIAPQGVGTEDAGAILANRSQGTDINQDGQVNILDFAKLTVSWGEGRREDTSVQTNSTGPGVAGYCGQTDVEGGTVCQ